jgi:hypothetical protein
VSAYSTGEAFTYRYDAVGNRAAMTSTTPLSGTVVTTYTFDAANRLTARAVSDGRAYTYTWSNRGQMLAEYTGGVPVRTFEYDGTGQMVKATVFTLTTEFVYNGLGARVALSVTGATTRYTLDYAAGQRILAETTPTETVQYLYGHDCLGEFRDDELALSGAEGWRYYLPDAEGYVRQGVDADGAIISAWLFDPDGTVLEGPNGPVSHLICGGVYDWSTGLLYKGGRYFDPALGIWLVLLPLAVIQAWPRRKKERGKHPWVMFLCIILVGTLTGCPPTPTPDPTPTRPPCTDTPTPVPPTPTPEPTPTPTLTPPTIPSFPLPSSFVRLRAKYSDGSPSARSAGVAIDTNAILSHNHHLSGRRSQTAADISQIEFLDPYSGDPLSPALIINSGDFLMAGDAELGGGLSLFVFRDGIFKTTDIALLGDADALDPNDKLLQAAAVGGVPSLYDTQVADPKTYPDPIPNIRGVHYEPLLVTPDVTVDGDSGAPLYRMEADGTLRVYGVNNAGIGIGIYGPVKDISHIRNLINNMTQELHATGTF